MTSYREFTLAAVRAAPIPFNREASTERACRLIEAAAAQGATLVFWTKLHRWEGGEWVQARE